MKKIILILSAFLLSGCVGVLFAGVAVGGAVATDQRSIGTITQDQNIAHQTSVELMADKRLSENSHIVVASFNRIVLLVGQAPSAAIRKRATRIVESIPNIRHIYNEITLSPPISTLTASQDAWITTKVKTKLIACSGLNATQIKIVTENSTVYLMGLVRKDQANLAVDIARHASGVHKVVKIFEYKG